MSVSGVSAMGQKLTRGFPLDGPCEGWGVLEGDKEGERWVVHLLICACGQGLSVTELEPLDES